MRTFWPSFTFPHYFTVNFQDEGLSSDVNPHKDRDKHVCVCVSTARASLPVPVSRRKEVCAEEETSRAEVTEQPWNRVHSGKTVEANSNTISLPLQTTAC